LIIRRIFGIWQKELKQELKMQNRI
jgi:hypothetical protein